MLMISFSVFHKLRLPQHVDIRLHATGRGWGGGGGTWDHSY